MKIIDYQFADFVWKHIQKRGEESEIVFYFVQKSRKKKYRKSVLLFSHEMTLTGAPLVLLSLAKIMVKKGYFVVVLSLEDGPLIQSFLSENISVIVDKSLKQYVLKEFDKENEFFFGLIEYFDFAIFNTIVLASFINRFINTRKKIVWWIHEGTFVIEIPELKRMFPKTLSNNILVRCVSKYSYDILKKNGLDYNAQIMPYGIKKVRFKTNRKSNEKINFLCIGSINERKGQSVLIDAIRSMPAEYNLKAEYHFVGKPSDSFGEAQIKILDDLIYNNDFIFYHNQLSHEQTLQLIATCDVVVVPSLDDPLPVTVAEALMFNKLVICTRNTGIAGLFENKKNILAIKTGDSKALIDAITQICSNYEYYRQIAMCGYEIYNSFFSMHVFKRNINDMIIKPKI